MFRRQIYFGQLQIVRCCERHYKCRSAGDIENWNDGRLEDWFLKIVNLNSTFFLVTRLAAIGSALQMPLSERFHSSIFLSSCFLCALRVSVLIHLPFFHWQFRAQWPCDNALSAFQCTFQFRHSDTRKIDSEPKNPYFCSKICKDDWFGFSF